MEENQIDSTTISKENSKEKILYYFGAGASAEALPLAKSVYDAPGAPQGAIIKEGLADALSTFSFHEISARLSDEKYQQMVSEMQQRSLELADKAKEFGDVDTYAKYLHLEQNFGPELSKLKRTLSEYFSLKQLQLNARDKRYLPWLVSIMNETIFPGNVKILNWNYDYQIQLANEKIGESEIRHYPTLDQNSSHIDSLSLIHLNGIAGYVNSTSDFRRFSVFQKNNRMQLITILDFLNNNQENSAMHFAWENGNYHKNLMDYVRSMITGTTIMVVIGYSFPFFNREIDKQIFDQLKVEQQFRKIYYQDPNLDGKQLIAQFNLGEKIDIVPIKQTNNFHIPFEY